MEEKEAFLFDLQGFLVVRHALEDGQVQELNRVLDEHLARDCTPDQTHHRFGGQLDWGKGYRDLLDNPLLTPYLDALLGPNFRLDHLYLDVIRSGNGPIGSWLHGGNTPFDPAQYYHYRNGRMYNGLTVVAYNLMDVGPEEGGFGCVPGSHKSNLPFPKEWRDMGEGLPPFVARVTGPAGSAVIFTEALTHGTLPWTGKGERRTLFLKYSPHPLSWAAGYFDADVYPDLSDRQRAILEAPNARYQGRKK